MKSSSSKANENKAEGDTKSDEKTDEGNGMSKAEVLPSITLFLTFFLHLNILELF